MGGEAGVALRLRLIENPGCGESLPISARNQRAILGMHRDIDVMNWHDAGMWTRFLFAIILQNMPKVARFDGSLSWWGRYRQIRVLIVGSRPITNQIYCESDPWLGFQHGDSAGSFHPK